MIKSAMAALAAGVMLLAACSESKDGITADTALTAVTDDSTIYGLACDGSNDTTVVFLRMPYRGGDPDTLYILEASARHMVYGDIRIGDRLAIVRNAEDTTKADVVIVTQDLLGQWCYKVKPTLKRRADTEGQTEEQVISQLPDSIAQLLGVELEYGMHLKIDSVATPIGLMGRQMTAGEDGLVEFPRLKMYRNWCIHNGHILLTETQVDSTGNAMPVATDTARLVMLTPDTMVLSISGKEQGYYRKRN